MKAKDLNTKIDCRICTGSGDDPADKSHSCRRCGGSGEINRFGPEDPGPYGGQNKVLLYEFLDEDTDMLHVQSMPISDESTGGFDERYGPKTVDVVSEPPISDYQQDMKDRLQNQLGENTDDGIYQMPNEEPYFGKAYSVDDMYEGIWPEHDPDLSIEYIISWLGARGDSYTEEIFKNIRENKDKYRL